MDITLRKASQVEVSIQNRIDELFRQTKTTIDVSIYADATKRRKAIKARMNEHLDKIDRLATIRFVIRSEVGKKNASVGISDRLAQLKHLQENSKRLSSLAGANPALVDEELEFELMGRRKNFENGSERYDGETVSVGLYLQEDLDAFEADLVRNRQKISRTNDELTELNANSTISISNEDAEVLRSEGVL